MNHLRGLSSHLPAIVPFIDKVRSGGLSYEVQSPLVSARVFDRMGGALRSYAGLISSTLSCSGSDIIGSLALSNKMSASGKAASKSASMVIAASSDCPVFTRKFIAPSLSESVVKDCSEPSVSVGRKIAIVTGASGRLGCPLLKRLKDAGYTVIGIERSRSADFGDHVILKADLSDKVEVEGVLDFIEKTYGTREIATVVHSAGKYGLEYSPILSEYRSANVETTRNLLNAFEKKGFKVGQFILFSSQTVYASASPGGLLLEGDSTREDYVYPQTKMEAERLVQDADMNTVIIRVPSVYSDDCMNDGIAKTIDLVTRQDVLARMYPGDQHENGWSYMHLDDFTRAIQCVVDERERLAEENPHAIFHIGEEGCTSQYAIQQAVSQALERGGFISISIPSFVGVLGAEFMDKMTGGGAPVHAWMVRALGRVAIDTSLFKGKFPKFKLEHSILDTIPTMVQAAKDNPQAFLDFHRIADVEGFVKGLKGEDESLKGPRIEEIA